MADDCLHPMPVRHELVEAPDVVPGSCVVGVEDVWAVFLNHHPGLTIAFCVAVSCHMVPGFKDFDIMSGV